MSTNPKKLLHIAHRQPAWRIWTNTFRNAVKPFGELEIIADGADLSEAELLKRMRGADILLTGWGSMPVPAAITKDPGNVKYICHITGEMRHTIPLEIIRSEIPVTNWGNAMAFEVAEGAMSLLLAMLKNLRGFIAEKEAGHWRDAKPQAVEQCGTLRGLKVGLYGLGFIGRCFLDLIRPYGSVLRAFDPYAKEWPGGVGRVGSLEELFKGSDAVVLHAGLTDETRNSVNAKLLALLPDHGIIINTARGGIIDQEALFAELETGRLRAGLDVLAGNDMLPSDHPALRWPNLILTSHAVGANLWPVQLEDPDAPLIPLHDICLENLRRFAAGEPLQFIIDEKRYLLMS